MGKRRKKNLAGELAAFLKSYGRKAPRVGEPNDRGYDRKLEARVKRMRPEELDAVLRDDFENEPWPKPPNQAMQ